MPVTTPGTTQPTLLPTERPALPTGPILVASDASADSDAAFPLARRLEQATGAGVHVVSIVPPFAMLGSIGELSALRENPYDELLSERTAAIAAQHTRMLGAATPWPATVRGGEPISGITDLAEAIGARCILTGRGQHSALQRVFHSETVVRLLQLGDTPVLATAPTLTDLPRRVLIATDFSEYSSWAALVATRLIAPDAVVFLVHVRPRYDRAVSLLQEPGLTDHATISRGLADLAGQLVQAVPTLGIEPVIREGNVYQQLVDLLHDSGAELAVSATHGHGFVRRVVMGSVAAFLVRESPCSVLSVPGHGHTRALRTTTGG